MNHHIQFTPQALEDLAQVDAPVAKRIIEKIQWLAEHFDQIQPETLTGAFANLYKLRVVHWRILYTIDSTQCQLTIHVVAHRRKSTKPDFSIRLSAIIPTNPSIRFMPPEHSSNVANHNHVAKRHQNFSPYISFRTLETNHIFIRRNPCRFRLTRVTRVRRG